MDSGDIIAGSPEMRDTEMPMQEMQGQPMLPPQGMPQAPQQGMPQ
jgi:hypothetical protein